MYLDRALQFISSREPTTLLNKLTSKLMKQVAMAMTAETMREGQTPLAIMNVSFAGSEQKGFESKAQAKVGLSLTVTPKPN